MHGLQSQLSYTPLWLLALAQTFALFTDTHTHTHVYKQIWKSAKRFHSFHFHVYENATSSSRPPRLQRPQAGANASRETKKGPRQVKGRWHRFLVACVRRVRAQTAGQRDCECDWGLWSRHDTCRYICQTTMAGRKWRIEKTHDQ